MNLPHIRFNHETQRYYAQGIPERALSPPQTGFELTTAEENGVQEYLEQLAEDEMLEGTPAFLDWLHNNKRVLHDWQEYRVATATDAERQAAIEQL